MGYEHVAEAKAFHALWRGVQAGDVYDLEVEDGRYRHGGKWLPLEKRSATIALDLGLFTLKIPRPVLASVHGPVLEAKGRFYAVRYAGRERSVQTVEQWYRMNKARTFAAWREAMALQAIPTFNAVYADAENIHYLYNALLPLRAAGTVPGQIPNATPFAATDGEGNPDPKTFASGDGIETALNNRARRTLALFSGSAPISAADFERFKFDRAYAPGSAMREMVAGLVEHRTPASDHERRALDLLRAWDGQTDPSSRAAAVAILTFRPPEQGGTVADAFRRAVAFLVQHHGSPDVPLGEVQRLRRRNASPHHADQAPFFVRRELHASPRTEAEIRVELEEVYRPGQERALGHLNAGRKTRSAEDPGVSSCPCSRGRIWSASSRRRRGSGPGSSRRSSPRRRAPPRRIW